MRITICGSMHFAKEMLVAKNKLEKIGHEAFIPIDTEASICNPELNDSFEHLENFAEIDLDKDHFNKISASDAILVLNYQKNNINGYVGGATLMEIAVARHLDKKIFVLFNLPHVDVLKYVLEIRLAKPIILSGDLNKII